MKNKGRVAAVQLLSASAASCSEIMYVDDYTSSATCPCATDIICDGNYAGSVCGEIRRGRESEQGREGESE